MFELFHHEYRQQHRQQQKSCSFNGTPDKTPDKTPAGIFATALSFPSPEPMLLIQLNTDLNTELNTGNTPVPFREGGGLIASQLKRLSEAWQAIYPFLLSKQLVPDAGFHEQAVAA